MNSNYYITDRNFYATDLAPNGFNIYGNPVKCYECDSLYHVQGHCPVQKSRFTKRDNKKLLDEIQNYKFEKKM